MSVESEYTPVQTACNGSLTAFAFGFPIFDTSDLKVYLKTVATAVKTLLTETTHYVVSATNNDYTNGGTVTTVATYSNAYEIIIERDIPYTQPTDLEQAGRIPSETLDDTHDRALMQIQQVNNKIQRALVMPVSDDSDLDMELPNEIDRASQFLAFDAAGEPIAAQTITGGTAATAYMQTLLDDADAATARATLGIDQVKIGSGSRATSGDQIIPGVGFPPSVVIFLAIDNTVTNQNWSAGFDDGTIAMSIERWTNGTKMSRNSTVSISITRDGSNKIYGTISDIGADGFTITWTLNGTCAVDFIYLCLP